MWQPGRATTYVLPVIEIEDIVSRLTRTRDDLISNNKNPIIVKLSGDSSVTIQQLNKLLDNWNTVLSNYRAHNKDMNTAFDQEQKIVGALMNTYQAWQTSIVSNGDLQTFVNNELTPTNPISIITGLLSGDSTGISKDLSTVSNKFKELGTETKSLSDGLAKLSRTVSVSSSRRQLIDLQSPQTLADALTALSGTFFTLSDKATAIASTFSSLASNPLLKTLATIIKITVPDLQKRFDEIFNKVIKTYVEPLINKVKVFASAAQTNLASFQSKVGDYLDTFMAALSAIDLCSDILANLFHDMADKTSGSLSGKLTDIAAVFLDIRTVEKSIAYFLNLLTQFFPAPTSSLKQSLITVSDKLTTLSASSKGFLNSVDTITTGMNNQDVITSEKEFTGFLSQVSTYADTLVPVFKQIETHVSILNPLFKASSSSSSTSSGSLASSIAAILNKFSALISKLSTQFTALTTAASASVSSFISKMSSMYTTVSATVKSTVDNINSLIEQFQQLITLASVIPEASTYLNPVNTDLNSFRDAVNKVPKYLKDLPELLKKALAQFDNGVLKSTLETSYDAFLNISTLATTVSDSSVSLSKALPSPYSVPLSPPFLLFSQVSSQLSKVSNTLALSLSSLISSSDFSAFSTVLSTLNPLSQQIIDMLSSMNSLIVYIAIELKEIDNGFGIFASLGSPSHRALLAMPRLSSIQDTLQSLYFTYNEISTEFVKGLNSAMVVSQDLSNYIVSILAFKDELPNTVTNILTAMKNAFSALANKIRVFITAYNSLSSPLSAVNPMVMNVISNSTDFSLVLGELSSNVASFRTYLPPTLSASLSNPLNDLSTVSKDMQTYSALLSSTLSYVSANTALNLIASVLTTDITTPLSASMNTLALKLSPLTDIMRSLVELFSVSSSASHRYLVSVPITTITNMVETLLQQLTSLSSALQEYLSLVADVCGPIHKGFAGLATSANPLSADVASSLSTIASTIESFSLTASSLGASFSSLLSTLSSIPYLAIGNLDSSMLNLSSSALNLSTTLVSLNHSLPTYFSPSLSPVLGPFSSKLVLLSGLTKSIMTVCMGPLTAGLNAISLIPGANSKLSGVLSALALAVSVLSKPLEVLSLYDPFISIHTTLSAELTSFYNAITDAVVLIQSGTTAFTSAVNNFESTILALPLSQSLLSVFQSLINLLLQMIQNTGYISSFVQSLASPLSSLSPDVSRSLTSLVNISDSALSIGATVNSVSKRFVDLPYAVTLPLLAGNMTQLSIYTTSVTIGFSSLSSSIDLALLSNILSTQFPSLNEKLASVASSLDILSSFFATLNVQLLTTADNNIAFLSTLLYPFSSWLELDNLVAALNTLASMFTLISNAVSSISVSLYRSLQTTTSYLSHLAVTSRSIVSLINELEIGPTSFKTVSKQSLSLNGMNSNRMAQFSKSLQLFSLSSKQFLDCNIDLLDSVLRPLYRYVSPPLEHLSVSLNNSYMATSTMSHTLSTVSPLSSLIPLISQSSAESLYSSLDTLTTNIDNIAMQMVNLSSSMKQRTNSVLEEQLRDFSVQLISVSSEIISGSESIVTTTQRLSDSALL